MTETTELTIESLAAEAYSHFTTTKRGEETIVVTKDDAPEWVRALVHFAHGGQFQFLPDDWRYCAISDALEYLADGGDPDDPDVFAEANVDVYTHDLNAWYSSNLNRASYCDQAQEDGMVSEDTDMTRRIAVGQYMELCEVYGLVVQALKEELENREEENV